MDRITKIYINVLIIIALFISIAVCFMAMFESGSIIFILSDIGLQAMLLASIFLLSLRNEGM